MRIDPRGYRRLLPSALVGSRRLSSAAGLVAAALQRVVRPVRRASDGGCESGDLSVAGAHGSRTHRATPGAAPPVLKTGEPTGTPPLPPRMVPAHATQALATRPTESGAAVATRTRPAHAT